MHAHAERGNDQLPNCEIDGDSTGLFPAKAGPTKGSACILRESRQTSTVGPALAGKPLICFESAFDLPKQKAQTLQNATWVQAERRSRAVGRAAGMRRERRQDKTRSTSPWLLGALSSNSPKAKQSAPRQTLLILI
ncbi:hypothetical protein AO263_30715 [Pseudomonas sp. NZIPFR-PS5]|nr:hypothetical protein AO263_30715 [Pseudomonas sp. NZIPFR-PS5]